MSVRVFLAAVASFIVLDGVWLGVIMNGFYRTHLGPMARTGPDGALTPIWAVAAPVYLLLALGISLFVVPKVEGAPWLTAAGAGALFGLVVYGTYDLTNWSMLRQYGATLAMVDLLWGVTVSAATTVIARAVARLF